MKDRPQDLDEHDLRPVLSEWGIQPAALDYAPVGFGDYHWIATDTDGRRWFVTAADLRLKEQDGEAALRRAMDTADALRELDFVVAPVRTAHDETVRLVGARYAVSVFPYLDGVSGFFGQELTPAHRGQVVDLLARLHGAAPPARCPVLRPEPALRALLEQAIEESDQSWEAGVFARAAGALVAGHAAGLRRRLAEFDHLARKVDRSELVVTHGEPHPGNLMWSGDRCLLVDWDTVGLAPPERDLWMFAEDLARYEDTSGRRPQQAALAFYRLRWALNDVAIFVDQFRRSHERTPDTEQAWAAFAGTVEELTA
ncbi:aminoglycoside phosphotransferase family protein [Nonomuraea sp. NPDC048916]|uniref:phosphotransferase enzyme family protein n=1 Tax=Nonomuraea sp. NPDC048916 TaxID=3154232 RepID=UPI0033DEB799